MANGKPYDQMATLLLRLFLELLFTWPALAVAALALLTMFFGKFLAHDLQASGFIAVYFLIAVYAPRNSEENEFSADQLIRRRP